MDRFTLPIRKTGMKALLTAVFLLASATSLAVTDAERIQVYQEFRAAFDAKQFAAALPLAAKLVSMTEQQLGPDTNALVNPLTNLGTVNLRLTQYPAAETAYQRALAIIEAQSSAGADPAQISTLHGLGEVLLATKRYEAAKVSLDRAVGLTRNQRGLYDQSQLAILPSLIECHMAMQNFALAEQQHQYAFRIAESTFGRADKRLLGPLDRYARWYELMGRYTTARLLHARGLQIAEQDGGQTSLLAVKPLRGLARSYWLEYINGPEETADTSQLSDAAGNNISVGRLNPDGERALQIAIATLNKQQPVIHQDLGETQLEFGDWYLLAGSPSKSNDAYRLAFRELESAGSASILATPKSLAYRATPSSTLRMRPEKPEDFDIRNVETRLVVGADGRVLDAVSVGGDAPDASIKAVVAALKRARYRPRLDASGAVETKELLYTERVYVRKPVVAATPAKQP